jgi:TctA family transporter
MISSGNDWTVFFKGPICGPLMVASLLALSYPLLREVISMRRRAAVATVSSEQR